MCIRDSKPYTSLKFWSKSVTIILGVIVILPLLWMILHSPNVLEIFDIIFLESGPSYLCGFTKKLIQACAWDSPLPLIAVHHADVNHLTVAAASIIAKDERERLIEELKKTLGIDFGCGYPHDQKTKEYLKVCPKNAAHVRWTWKTHLSYH